MIPALREEAVMGASDFEFRYRFWIFGAIFFIAFGTYNADHVNASQALIEWLARLRGVAAADWQYHAIFAIAALFCVANAAVRTWATAYLNPEVMVDSRLHTTRLLADGPYRYVRNPLYFGNVLLAIGFGMMASRIGFVILVGGMIVFVYRLILREEAGIRANQARVIALIATRCRGCCRRCVPSCHPPAQSRIGATASLARHLCGCWLCLSWPLP
jgi:protein-S-isoprenylcysteine O-methyltransferase Ste14